MKQVKAFFRHRPYIAGFLLGIVLITVAVTAFEAHNGPHPECAVNDSVGPCDLTGRVVIYSPAIVYTALGTGALSVAAKIRATRKNSSKRLGKKKADLQKTRFIMWASLAAWLLLPAVAYAVAMLIVVPIESYWGVVLPEQFFMPIYTIAFVYFNTGWAVPVLCGYHYWHSKRAVS